MTSSTPLVATAPLTWSCATSSLSTASWLASALTCAAWPGLSLQRLDLPTKSSDLRLQLRLCGSQVADGDLTGLSYEALA